MRITRKQLAVGVVAVGAALAFAVPAAAAVSVQSESPGAPTIKIAKKAQLMGNGAATKVTLNITCPVGSHFEARVQVGQTVGSSTTGGSAYTQELICTGAVQKVKLTALASPSPFKPGVAVAVGDVTVYGYNYSYAQTSREIINVAS